MALDDKPSADGRRSFIKNTALFLAATLSTPAAGAQKSPAVGMPGGRTDMINDMTFKRICASWLDHLPNATCGYVQASPS